MPDLKIQSKKGNSCFQGCLALFALAVIAGFALMPIFARFLPTDDFVLPKYLPETVASICATFEIEKTDEFCTNPSAQDAGTFREMFHRLFPRNKTHYLDVTSKMSHFRSSPGAGCDNPVKENFGWALDNCPPPNECTSNKSNHYDCGFAGDFAGEQIGITVLILKESGLVGGYGVSHPSESTD